MQDVLGMVGALSRPKLLVRAARFGVEEYSRERHLPRILRSPSLPRSGEALMRLMEIEAEMNDRRRARAADYAIAAHVEALIAIMGEARLLRATARPVAVT